MIKNNQVFLTKKEYIKMSEVIAVLSDRYKNKNPLTDPNNIFSYLFESCIIDRNTIFLEIYPELLIKENNHPKWAYKILKDIYEIFHPLFKNTEDPENVIILINE